MNFPSRGAVGSGLGHKARRRLGLAALVAAPFLLSGCTMSGFGAYKSATSTGRSTFHLWQGFTIGAIIVGGITLGLILWSAIRYRAGKKHDDSTLPRQSQYHLPMEITYTVIPIIIVIALFAATVVVENKVTADPPASTTVEVFAARWGWQFTYPAVDFAKKNIGFSIVGQTTQSPIMEIPEGENTRIFLQSIDVVHGFYIRQFNFSRYALPGVNNEFTFNAIRLGTFFGRCTQLCGLYHSLMWFRVRVVTPAAYQAWLRQEVAATTIVSSFAAKIAASQLTSAQIPVKPYIASGVK